MDAAGEETEMVEMKGNDEMTDDVKEMVFAELDSIKRAIIRVEYMLKRKSNADTLDGKLEEIRRDVLAGKVDTIGAIKLTRNALRCSLVHARDLVIKWRGE